MMTIGEFARHGRVSVRMLRHYDATGLLRPARVDPATGYRFYEVAQLARLNRVVALKDLGLSLRQVAEIVDEKVGTEQLRGMLRLRRAELAAAIAADTARLAQVEARLSLIESESAMPDIDVVVRSLPPVRLAELSAAVAGFGPDEIGPVVGPLFMDLERRLHAAGVAATGPAIAYYEEAPAAAGEGAFIAHAGIPVDLPPGPDSRGFDVVHLPAVEQAATVVHSGPPETIFMGGQRLARWLDESSYRGVAMPRELYLSCPPGRPGDWVTELQVAVIPA